MRSPRAGFTAIAMRDGRVLLAGGFLDNEPTTSDAEIFDPLTGTMTPTGSMAEPRGAYAAAPLPDGRILFAGGLAEGKIVASAEIYDPATGRFQRTAPLESARYKAAAVTLEDGRVMVLGGAADVEGDRLFATTEIYDPRRDVFSPDPSMLWPRYKLAGRRWRCPTARSSWRAGLPRRSDSIRSPDASSRSPMTWVASACSSPPHALEGIGSFSPVGTTR